MYTRQEASLIRKNFWTSFGQYMKPLPGADGETINWLNYKTGIKDVYFRLDVDQQHASVSIEMRHADLQVQDDFFERLQQLGGLLEEQTGEKWTWEQQVTEEDGKIMSRVSIALQGVTVFNKSDWPAIISFFKPRILALDQFWSLARYAFE